MPAAAPSSSNTFAEVGRPASPQPCPRSGGPPRAAPAAAPFRSPSPPTARGRFSSQRSQHVPFSHMRRSTWCAGLPPSGSICVSLMSDVGHLFTGLFASCVSPSEKRLFRASARFLIGLFGVFGVELCEFFICVSYEPLFRGSSALWGAEASQSDQTHGISCVVACGVGGISETPLPRPSGVYSCSLLGVS